MHRNLTRLLAFRDGEVLTCDMPHPEELSKSWKPKRENQIMGSEMVSIALGARLCRAAAMLGDCPVYATCVPSFAKEQQNRDCVLWNGNSGAEHALRKGGLPLFFLPALGQVQHVLAWKALLKRLTTTP